MKVAIAVLIIGSILLVLLLNKNHLKKALEAFSIYWFRFALSFLALFIANIAAGYIGIYVPINILSGLVITILGIPGFISIFVLAIIL